MSAVNIYGGSKNWMEPVLSNLAHTPLVYRSIPFALGEGFHQGIKYEDKERRRWIFMMHGVKAKSAGREANKLASGFVYFEEDSKPIIWQSE